MTQGYSVMVTQQFGSVDLQAPIKGHKLHTVTPSDSPSPFQFRILVIRPSLGAYETQSAFHLLWNDTAMQRDNRYLVKHTYQVLCIGVTALCTFSQGRLLFHLQAIMLETCSKHLALSRPLVINSFRKQTWHANSFYS